MARALALRQLLLCNAVSGDKPDVVSAMTEIVLKFRGWTLEVTDTTAIATQDDGSQERFECHRQPCFEEALRMAKAKIDWNEGPEKWDMDYTDGALK